MCEIQKTADFEAGGGARSLPLEPGAPRRLSTVTQQSPGVPRHGLPTPLRSPGHQGLRRAKAQSTVARRTARRLPRLQSWRGSRADPEAHLAITRFALKRLRADLRTAAELSSDDETHFARKEARRLIRDRARLAPVVLGAP